MSAEAAPALDSIANLRNLVRQSVEEYVYIGATGQAGTLSRPERKQF